MKPEHKQFEGRKIAWDSDDLGRYCVLEDQNDVMYQLAGRGETDEEAIENLYDNQIERDK